MAVMHYKLFFFYTRGIEGRNRGRDREMGEKDRKMKLDRRESKKME
jgi:hypothetical protein